MYIRTVMTSLCILTDQKMFHLEKYLACAYYSTYIHTKLDTSKLQKLFKTHHHQTKSWCVAGRHIDVRTHLNILNVPTLICG